MNLLMGSGLGGIPYVACSIFKKAFLARGGTRGIRVIGSPDPLSLPLYRDPQHFFGPILEKK